MSSKELPGHVGEALRIIHASGGAGSLALRPPMDLQGGLCSQTDPDLFFPGTGESPAAAKAICAKCDIRLDCAVQTIVDDASGAAIDVNGVSGGMSRAERLTVRSRLVATSDQEAA